MHVEQSYTEIFSEWSGVVFRRTKFHPFPYIIVTINTHIRIKGIAVHIVNGASCYPILF